MWISRRMTGDRTPTHAYIMQYPANRVKLTVWLKHLIIIIIE
jgi:hypothetical protein